MATKKKKNNKNDTENKKRNKKETKKETKKNGKEKFSKRHPKATIIIRIVILLCILMAVIGSGILIGMVYGVFGNYFEITQDELTITGNSKILDRDGNVLAELSGDENRTIITLEEMSSYLPKAYVAIEDERFYTHKGVDLKRTGGAIFTYVINRGSSSFGGSTITQQLVKNITKDNAKSGKEGIIRKVKEWAKAFQVEKMLSKDQILELYLNIIFVGNNYHGVEKGAEYYFNKKASELDLAECAFLAGINNAPNKYNPFNGDENIDKIKKRTKTVLSKMLELGYITQEECDSATQKVENGLPFQKGATTGSVYSYHTDATIAQVIADIAEEKQISTTLATNYVYSSGLKIYSTQVTSIQTEMETEFAKTSKYTLTSKTIKDSDGNYQKSQAAMVIVEPSTGYVVGCVGGLGEKTSARGLNRATQSTRQTGSSIKPLAVLVPGIEEGIITASTIYNDTIADFGNDYKPKDYNTPRNLISIRSAVTTSQNVPFVKAMTEITTTKALEYLRKMGITTLDDKNDSGLSLSIGGLYNGISPLEMASAYGTIANNGVYVEPTFYTKVEDSEGNVVLEPEQKRETAMSEKTAYIVKNLLTSVVTASDGTAKYCAISGKDVAAKTGTTNDEYDRWLCGFTNYYAAATWYGFDQNEEVVFKGTNPAGQLWSNIMKNIHSGLAESRFEMPAGVVTKTVCTKTGELATENCTSTYSEIFLEDKLPSTCSGHTAQQICVETGLLANQYCENVETRYYGYTIQKETLGLWKNLNGATGFIGESSPTEYCTIHTEKPDTTGPVITLNGAENMTLNVGETYKEQGAKATDDKDGDLTNSIVISGAVNTSKAGTYTVTYTVKDSKGNTSTKKRTIIVKGKETSDNKPLAGNNTTNNTADKTPDEDGEDNETKDNTTTNNSIRNEV